MAAMRLTSDMIFHTTTHQERHIISFPYDNFYSHFLWPLRESCIVSAHFTYYYLLVRDIARTLGLPGGGGPSSAAAPSILYHEYFHYVVHRPPRRGRKLRTSYVAPVLSRAGRVIKKRESLQSGGGQRSTSCARGERQQHADR